MGKIGTKSSDMPVKTVSDRVYANLRTQLFDGVYAPGEQVSIRQVAEREGTSVIPARDALRGLVTEGALEFRGARAIAVPELSADTVGEIGHARQALEVELARRAFPHLSDHLDKLQTLDLAVDDAIMAHDGPAYVSTNRAFHFTIYEQANAPVLLALTEQIWLRLGPSMRIVYKRLGGTPPDVDMHKAAMTAITQNDPAAFCRAIEADISQGMDILLDGATSNPKEIS